MGGGGHDWQDRELEREEQAKKQTYEPPTLKAFSDRELQAELRKRKAHAKTEAERMEAKTKHNAPIERQIAELHQKINQLKSKLK